MLLFISSPSPERAERVDRTTIGRRASHDFPASAKRPSCPREVLARKGCISWSPNFEQEKSPGRSWPVAEARKYGLALVLAHQYLDQLTDEIRQSVFGNVGNLIAFRVGQADARILEDELGGDVKMGNLVSLMGISASPEGGCSWEVDLRVG